MLRLFSLILGLCLMLPATFAEDVWLDDLDAAKKEAVKQKKDMLVLYKGSGYEDKEKGDSSLFESPYFLKEARKKYVLAEQPLPVMYNEDGEPKYTATRLMCADAQGRPYDEITDYENGLDWIIMKLDLATIRRPIVAKAITEVEKQGESPSVESLQRLFLTLPLYVEDFYVPYKEWLARLEETGDNTVTHLKEERALCNRVFNDIISGFASARSLYDVQQLLNQHSEVLEKFPVTKQGVNCSIQFMLTVTQLKESDIETLGKQLKKNYKDSILLAPKSEYAHYLKKYGDDYINALCLMLKVKSADKKDPATAEMINQFKMPANSLFARQIQRIFQARMLTEEGKWQEAIKNLQDAIEFNPLTRNAAAAQRLIEAIDANRELLNELLPRCHKGNAALDALWNKLMITEINCSIVYTVGDDYIEY